MISALSKAMDCISPAVGNHHARVGYIAGRLGKALALDAPTQRDLLIAGLLHDAGALSLGSRLDALQFETDGVEHSIIGYRLLRSQPRLQRVALLVKDHHTPYAAIRRNGEKVEPLANLINLADRVDVLVRRDLPLEAQLPGICNKLRSTGSVLFNPLYVEAFLDLSRDAEFVEQAASPLDHITPLAHTYLEGDALEMDELVEFSMLFSQIIDFRSRFTATHSQGVAAISERLAVILGFDEEEATSMHVAGNLHDLGKLAVPVELLDKAGPLTKAEFERIKQHAVYSAEILCKIEGLGHICEWAAHHHERIDGTGYPYRRGKNELSLGARIIAVADVFTAITEDRPYRAGMDRKQAMEVMRNSVKGGALDSYVVSELLANYDAFNELRSQEQACCKEKFQAFYKEE